MPIRALCIYWQLLTLIDGLLKFSLWQKNQNKNFNKKIKQKNKYLGIKMWQSIISVGSIIVSKIPKCGFAWEKQDGIVLIS